MNDKRTEVQSSAEARPETLSAPAATQDWQPIDTAPREARGIVASLYPREDVGWMVGEAFRDSIGVWWWAQTLPNDEGFPHAAIDPQPTHWMPLPSPPRTTDAPADKE